MKSYPRLSVLFATVMLTAPLLAHAGLNPATYIGVKGVPRTLPKLLTQAFPITISTPGSFALSGNLSVPNSNTTAILVLANDVTIDMNGFAILGPVTCAGNEIGVTVCAGTGTGYGIDASDVSNTTVLNGTIRGMGNDGIILAGGRVENVTVASNGSAGMNFLNDASAIVTGCAAEYNGAAGIDGQLEAVVTRSTASYNGGTGIIAQSVSTSKASYNMLGIAGSTLIGNTVDHNVLLGMFVTGGGFVNNTIFDNGDTVELVGSVSMGSNVCDGSLTCP